MRNKASDVVADVAKYIPYHHKHTKQQQTARTLPEGDGDTGVRPCLGLLNASAVRTMMAAIAAESNR